MARSCVLLHGAMLGSWIWGRVVPLLPGPALAVDLPGRGDHPADVTGITLADAVASVVDDVEASNHDDVVLVAHSLSGILVPALVERLQDRVTQVVFVSAVVPDAGRPYVHALPFGQRVFLRAALLVQRRGVLAPPSALRRALCNDLDEDTTDLVLRNATREAPRLYRDPVPGTMPLGRPVVYVELTRDHAFQPRLQRRMLTRVPGARVESLDTGHLPMLADPEGLAALLGALLV